jgi:hypothetical protein
MGRVTDADLLPEAVAELYASSPDEFIKRRGELAARAREAGQAAQAKRIAGLRKPTRAAWIINQLIRADPSAGAQLADLGEQLRAAQNSLDGAAIRDLSLHRRHLIDALARQAFAAAGQSSPPAAIRAEVTATLGAALADPQVAERVCAGTLDRAAHGEGFGGAGFGATGARVLTLVRPPAGAGSDADGRAAGSGRYGAAGVAARHGIAPGLVGGGGAAPRSGPRAAVAADRRPGKMTELAAARARAERERRRHAISEAERDVAEADWALEAAEKTEHEYERAVQRLEEQLAEARHCLAEARQEARQATAAQHQARRALDRLRK